MKQAICRITLALSGILLAMDCIAQDVYESLSIEYSGGDYQDETFQYRLMRPAKVEAGQRYPLIVFLHGAGERGTDNQKQLLYLPTLMANKERREAYPCFLLAPQCRPGKQWVNVPWGDKQSTPMAEDPSHQLSAAMLMLKRTLKDEPIDTDRVYLTGLSMGGYGTWELAARTPQQFAAVAPICGGGDEKQASKLKSLPTWAFHGDADNAVPVARSRSMIDAIRGAGGEPKYTEYPGVGHNSWNKAYADEALMKWMFTQRRRR